VIAKREQYRFGEFTLDVTERRLSRNGTPIHVGPKAYDVLVALVRQAGRLVTKRALLEQVWPGAFVEEGILTVHTSSLRKALGDASRHPAYIETIPGSGYRFVANVTPVSPDNHSAPQLEPTRPLEAYDFRTSQSSTLGPSRPGSGDKAEPFSVAVLPFANLSLDPDQEYWSDGLSDELTSALSRLARIRTVSRSSVFAFKGKPTDVREAGRLLSADVIVEGSVRMQPGASAWRRN
jgi:DNA-binding winged helix-turn-helix (wHTH) protein